MGIQVHLEVASDGTALAHVLALPGCFARGVDRTAAVAAVPAAVDRHRGWLRSHGLPEEKRSTEDVEVTVVEEQTGWAPIRRGDRAALFGPERAPLGRFELTRLLAIAAAARADLLALAERLPADLLDRPADDGETTIRGVLRHVGNTGEWYVSRLVPPETLPLEWVDDEALPILDFLEMEGRTALDRLRRLTDEELAAEVTQPRWTDHPDELWTARKALRRRIEHELEHLEQIRAILACWKPDATW